MVGLIERDDNEMIRKSSLVFVIQRSRKVLSGLALISSLILGIAPVALTHTEPGQVATDSSDESGWEVP